jgi:AcrR family transcriptional regulator
MTDSSASPVRNRGEKTRAKLLRAARTVFERDGFIEARISDIAKSAGVSHGTFYTYFSSKEEIFRELVTELQSELARPHEPPAESRPSDPVSRIDAGNRAYLEGYRRNAKLMATLEQVSTFNDEMRELRKSTRGLFVERSARSIRGWQEQGVADPQLDPRVASSALCNMVDRFAYVWLVLGEEFDFDVAATTLTRLWCQALGMSVGDAEVRPLPKGRARVGGRTPRTRRVGAESSG